ncbi:MAG: hypothetical protein JJE52_00080 [Acidimicrobiia bacterium]|nr:hypothetical protein [Acidimicrobiia bacterium]
MSVLLFAVADRPAPVIGASLVSSVAATTLLVATVEVVLLRLVSRTAIHIPGASRVEGPMAVVDAVGRYSVVAAGVLVAVTAVLVAVRLVGAGSVGGAAAIATTLLASSAARLGWIGDSSLAVAAVVSVVVLTVGIIGGRGRVGVPVASFSVAFVAAAIHATSQGLAGVGDLRPTTTVGLLLAAELIVVVAAVTLPLAVGHLRPRDLVGGIAAGLVAWGALAASSATTKVLVLWSMGVPGYFPAAVYAVAVGAAATALLAAARTDRDLAVSLGLLVVGGIGLHNSYQTLLVVSGLALLAVRAIPSPSTSAEFGELIS